VSSCAIEDDTDFIHWTFSTETSQNQAETGSQNPTVELKGLKSFGKEIKPEPSLPNVKDLRGKKNGFNVMAENMLSFFKILYSEIIC
jgi:hypothetical protein